MRGIKDLELSFDSSSAAIVGPNGEERVQLLTQ